MIAGNRGYAAAFFAVIIMAAITILSRQAEVPPIPYVLLLSAGSALVFLLIARTKQLDVRTVLAVSVLLHIVSIFGNAAFEDDYFRFIWDGWRTLESGTPYGIAPASFFGTDINAPGMALALDGINYPEIPTIYGPTLQLVFAAIHWIGGADPIALRTGFAILNFTLILILTHSARPAQLALYAWCPMVISEIVIHIHPDAVMALFIAAFLLLARRHPVGAGIMLGVATGAKIVALILWPLLLRMGWRAMAGAMAALALLYAIFLIQGQGAGFGTTALFAGEWLFNPFALGILNLFLPPVFARVTAAIMAITIILLIHARTRSVRQAPVAALFATVLLFAPAVNGWYLLWLFPFAIGMDQLWPRAAIVALPFSYLTGFNLGITELGDFDLHWPAAMAQFLIIGGAAGYDLYRWLTGGKQADVVKPTPIKDPDIAVIIPALNEAASIAGVVKGILAQDWPCPPLVIVADNGSTDGTGDIARMAGAHVVAAPERGYGAACLAALSALNDDHDIILFMDGDGSDVPKEARQLLQPIMDGRADLTIGSRALGKVEAGAMTIPQRFGNRLATFLIRLFWGKKMTDLGPFRAIRRDALETLRMADRNYGWTVEMQVKAARHGLRIIEVPADYRRRIGTSKISGTIRGVIGAGSKILYIIGREAFFR